MRRTITAIATLGLVGSALLAAPVVAFTTQADAATAYSRHHVRHAMPRYYDQAPIEQRVPTDEYPSAAQRYYTDPPGWHDPSGCGMRCF